MKLPLIGAHVSAAGNMSLAPQRAAAIGCECFQFFSRPPQGGQAKPITVALAKKFKAQLKKYHQSECYVHAPYFINLASADNRIYYGSISVLKEELARASRLGAKYLMTHLGSAKDLGEREGIKKVIRGILEILKDYKGSTQFLIEMSAGAGAIIGDTFEEIAAIIKGLKAKSYQLKAEVGVCFDTAHAFASGYDLRNEKAVQEVFKRFDKVLGLEKLKLIHTNDSAAELNSKKDRHENIGRGKIGLAGFRAVVKFAQKQKINLIIETRNEAGRKKDVEILKKLKG